MASKTYSYRGYEIVPCTWAEGIHAGRWYVRSRHESGTAWGDESSTHYASLAAAREAIDSDLQHRGGE